MKKNLTSLAFIFFLFFSVFFVSCFNNNNLAEPAGGSIEFYIPGSVFQRSAGVMKAENDLSAFEDRNRAYLNLLKQRNDAKKKYDESGDIGALKEYTSADQQLKALKDQEKEKKNNAKEERKQAGKCCQIH